MNVTLGGHVANLLRRSRSVVIVMLLLMGSFTLVGCSTIGSQLKKYGYNELQPPSTLLPPGTIITLLDRHPLRAGIICPQEAAFGRGLPLKISDTSQSELAQKTTGEFNIDANYLKEIQANAKYKFVRGVKLKLTNVKVYEITDDIVVAQVNKRSDACVKAMNFRRAQKVDISLIKSVLGADVEYTVDFASDAGLDVSAKQGIIKDLALTLKANVGTARESTVKGSSLFWGVIDDMKLAEIGRDDEHKVSKNKSIPLEVQKNLSVDRILPAGEVVQIIVE